MSPGIVIVGLGPGDPRWLTRAAWEELTGADEIHVRTSQHPIREHLPADVRLVSFDALYDQHDDFQAVYDAIAGKVIELGKRQQGVVYAVPGDPTVGEMTVIKIREQAARDGIELTVIHGVSFLEPCLELLGRDALDGLTIVDALDLASSHHPQVATHHGVLVGQLYSRLVASDVKLTLMNAYPDEHEVVLLHAAGLPSGCLEPARLHDFDASPNIGLLTALFVPPLHAYSSFERLQETVAHLRAPEGCPWDREQTHQSLRQHLLEEAYEALQAIDRADLKSLEEELGDLMLQIVLQTQIATEAEAFQMADVVAGINDKLIRRHPHVFEDLEVADVDQVLHNWEALKARERAASDGPASALSGVPSVLPALALSHEYQARAARVGFDWASLEGVKAKVLEELDELEAAASQQDEADEFGDLLFSLVNYARWRKIDPEAALREASRRFRSRFETMESLVREKTQDLGQLDLDELEALWTAAKRNSS